MDVPPMLTDAHGPGLPAILQSAAAELVELATLADDLGVCQAADAERWQSLDRMSQHLNELAKFLSAVSKTIPDLRPDLAGALAAIRVGRLVNRLTACPMVDEDAAAGELEMFGA